MRREARLLAAIAETPVPHPRLIAACLDEGVLGAVFYLMEPIDGCNVTQGLSKTHQSRGAEHRMGLAMIEGLAALHALDHAALGLADFGKPIGFLERQVSRWRSQLRGYGELAGWPGAEGLGDVDSVADWLEAKLPASFTPGILHGDFHLANVMFRADDAELAAIIDWELATIGDPLIDLGWILASWPQQADGGLFEFMARRGFPRTSELASHYAKHASRTVEKIDWYGIFACYKLGILLEGTYARACAGQAQLDVGERLHRQAVWLFARAQRWMAQGVISGED
jgi:aminoglycoside phosphotransferase (APT) family kinase protein